MEFALIIKFILIGLMAFSAISYLFQRSGNKQNLKNAIESHQTTRQLNEDEYQLLKPYLDDKTKVKPYKYQSSLVNSDVSIITGSCVRHSLSTNGNESSYYFVIGSIEVFFPYGMDIYTLTDNVAEVVFTPGYAFVVNLNGYSLADAKAAQDAEELRNEQWQQGSRGEFKTVTEDDINHLEHVEQSDAGVSAFIAEAKNKRCEILEQREESPLEAQRKNQQNLGFLCAVFLILTVIMALTYEFDDDLWMIIISGISLVLALIFYVSKPKKTVHKINRVKGTVEDKSIDAKIILIGDSLILSYPKHWQDILPAKTTIDADMDVVVEEKSLLRYGHNLSISKEIEQYGPPKFWGRNCFIFIVGFALSLMIYLFSSSLKDDAIFSYRFASNQMTILDIKDNETLKKTTILSGDQVNLDLLGAWCDVEPSYGCKKAFVADEGIDIANIVNQVPNWAKKSFDGSLVATIRDEKVKALEQYSSLFVNGDSDYYSNNNKKNYTRLLNIEQLTLVTDEACATDNYSCSRLKDIFMILLTDENKKQLPTWSALVDYAKKQQNRSAIIYASNAQEIINLFSRLSEDFLHKQQESISKLLQQKQDEPNKVIIITVTNNHDANVIATGINQNKKNTTEYYIAIAGGLGQLELNGLVNDVSYHNDGSVASISINPDIRYQISDDQMIPAALITFISFMVIAIITLWQLLVMLNKIRINKYRLRHIQSDYRNLTL